MDCIDCDKCEQNIIRRLKETCIHKQEYGNEYFEGDKNTIRQIVIEESSKSFRRSRVSALQKKNTRYKNWLCNANSRRNRTYAKIYSRLD